MFCFLGTGPGGSFGTEDVQGTMGTTGISRFAELATEGQKVDVQGESMFWRDLTLKAIHVSSGRQPIARLSADPSKSLRNAPAVSIDGKYLAA